jgi:hypothetical protein
MKIGRHYNLQPYHTRIQTTRRVAVEHPMWLRPGGRRPSGQPARRVAVERQAARRSRGPRRRPGRRQPPRRCGTPDASLGCSPTLLDYLYSWSTRRRGWRLAPILVPGCPNLLLSRSNVLPRQYWTILGPTPLLLAMTLKITDFSASDDK